jgi:hypothetical protein
MAVELTVYIIDAGDDTIKVAHTFFGETEREARTYKREHEHSCEYFAAAVKEDRTREELEEVDSEDLPCAEDFEDDEVLDD